MVWVVGLGLDCTAGDGERGTIRSLLAVKQKLNTPANVVGDDSERAWENNLDTQGTAPSPYQAFGGWKVYY
jgi:hypothetical protein